MATSFQHRILPILLFLLAAAPAWGAIATDVIVSTDRSSSSTSITSPSFSTTAAHELLLAFIATDATSAGVSVTGVAGAGLTWALVRRTNVQLGTAEVWRAFAPTTLSSVTVRANISQSIAASITVVSFTGVDPSGANGSGAIGATGSGNANPGAPSATLVTTRNNSWVWGVGNDWDQRRRVDLDAAEAQQYRTPVSGQVLVHQRVDTTTGDTYWAQSTSAPSTAFALVDIHDSSPTTDQWNYVAVEIVATRQ